MQLDQLLDQKTVRQYLDHLKTRGVPSATIERKLASIKKFSGWAERSDLVMKMTRSDLDLRMTRFDLGQIRVRSNLVGVPTRLDLVDLYRRYTNSRIASYLHLAILVLFSATMAVFGYNQIFKD